MIDFLKAFAFGMAAMLTCAWAFFVGYLIGLGQWQDALFGSIIFAIVLVVFGGGAMGAAAEDTH